MTARQDALRFTPTPATDVLYPRGSIVVCRDCGKPLYRLQQSIFYGEPVARSAWKYAPVTMKDLDELMDRSDLEPGQRAAIKAMSPEARHLHCNRIPTVKAGDFMDCPLCRKQFATGFIPESRDGASMFNDKGYRVTLAIIPPQGQGRRSS
jgi:hypothetical protein